MPIAATGARCAAAALAGVALAGCNATDTMNPEKDAQAGTAGASPPIPQSPDPDEVMERLYAAVAAASGQSRDAMVLVRAQTRIASKKPDP